MRENKDVDLLERLARLVGKGNDGRPVLSQLLLIKTKTLRVGLALLRLFPTAEESTVYVYVYSKTHKIRQMSTWGILNTKHAHCRVNVIFPTESTNFDFFHACTHVYTCTSTTDSVSFGLLEHKQCM